MLHSCDIRATLWQVESLPAVEFLTAAYTHHAFPKHTHEAYVIQVIEQGVNRFLCETQTLTASTGSVAIIHPDEVHTGYSLHGQELRYRSFYVQPSFFEEFTEKENLHPVFGGILPDHDLARRFLHLHRTSQAAGEDAETQDSFYQAMGDLLTTHAADPAVFARLNRREADRVIRAKRYLRDCAAMKVSLDDVAREVGLSPFHFLRLFRQHTGLSPHEYLLSFRVEQARQLLKQKHPVAQVALETGFSDQSHLTRRFKKIVGLTPGQYLRAV